MHEERNICYRDRYDWIRRDDDFSELTANRGISRPTLVRRSFSANQPYPHFSVSSYRHVPATRLRRIIPHALRHVPVLRGNSSLSIRVRITHR